MSAETPPSDRGQAYAAVNDAVVRTLRAPGPLWAAGMAASVLGVIAAAIAWAWQVYTGLGVAGISHPVGWGVYIVTFVFWVGIAHSGTLISAILYLFRSQWRTSVYRVAEAMTVFAVLTAGLFPLIHLGRVWYFYWLIPYPNQRLLWPNFRSPLIWDVFAVSTYLATSALFFLVGLLPDVAAARDSTTGTRHRFYKALSLGWTGTERQWHHYGAAYLFLAAFATPLVISVHSVVSWDFAMGIVPGWHSLLFPPYFVAGAIFSGCAMVLTILVPMRRMFHLERYVTTRHLERLAMLVLLTSTIVGYAYLTEVYFAWAGVSVAERQAFQWRLFGEASWGFWIMVVCNVLTPLLLWSRRIRRHPGWLFGISLVVNVGMWFERYVIVSVSLMRGYEPWAFGGYRPSWVELTILAGSFCWFFMWFLLFARTLPSMSIIEVKETLQPPVRVPGPGAPHPEGPGHRGAD
ncbi:polysulfide reductase NrfD [Myxococcota bacterium]|nr:polysulfide reductase NrfD [Myxococcota bacterium]